MTTDNRSYVPPRFSLRRIRPWVRYRRWRLRCAHCGWGFMPHHSVNGYGNKDEHFHDVCIGYTQQRLAAQERLEVLDLLADVWGITMSDATTLMANRAVDDGFDHSNAWNKAWRVFYALDKHRKAKEAADA